MARDDPADWVPEVRACTCCGEFFSFYPDAPRARCRVCDPPAAPVREQVVSARQGQGKPWASSEDARLRELWRDQTMSHYRIAEALDRSLESVRYRIDALGLPPRRFGNQWSLEEERKLRRMFAAGMSTAEIGKAVGGRTARAVAKKIQHLGLR